MREPLLLPMLAFAAGILASQYAELTIREAVLACCGTAALGLAGRRWKSAGCARLGALAALFFAGAVAQIHHRPGSAPQIDSEEGEILLLEGCVVEPPAVAPDRWQFLLELEPGARARVTLPLEEGAPPPDFGYGTKIQIEAKVRKPRNFRNPGAFDYVRYLARRDIHWTASVPKGSPVLVLDGRCGSAVRRAIFTLRQAALRRIEILYPKDGYAQAMTKAILIGDTTNLERVWVEHFRRTGTYHALVISGLHVVVLAGTLYTLLRLCFLKELYAALLSAAGVWLYAAITGWSAPAVRAAGGFTLYLIGRHMYRRGRILNLLSAVALLYLAVDPQQLFEASFQLSFLSVAAIGAFAEPFSRAATARYIPAGRRLNQVSWDAKIAPNAAEFRVELRLLIETLTFWTRIPKRVLNPAAEALIRVGVSAGRLLILSAVMQIALALPMAIYFHRISVTGLTANLIVTPLMSLMVPVGFAAIFTGLAPAAWGSKALLDVSAAVAGWHVQFEPSHRIPDPPLWAAFALVAGLLAAAITIRRYPRLRLAAIPAALAAFVLVLAAPFEPLVQPGILELTAIDVGQGEALMVTTPERKVLLIDTGGIPMFGRTRKPRLEIGEDVVSPYLWRRRIQRVDAIAATHAHEDHIGGLEALVQNFRPSEIWTGAIPDGSPGGDVLKRARADGICVVGRTAGEQFGFGGVQVEILSPPRDYIPREQPHNDDSLVLRIRYGKHSFLLTGDIESEAEWSLVDRNSLAPVTVLKVAHHGSRSSTLPEFLDITRPAFAVISAGNGNFFHHPHPELIERLRHYGAGILRTDSAGLVSVRSDGMRIRVETAALQAGENPWDEVWAAWAE